MSKIKSGKGSLEENKSLFGLAEAPFLQDDWRCFTAFLFPSKKCDSEIISFINDAINRRTRKHFSIVDCSLIIQEARQIAQSNKSKLKSLVTKTPQFIEICDRVKDLVDQGEFISPKIFALVLKFKFLMIKEKANVEKESRQLDDDLKKLEIEKSITKLQSPSKVGKKALNKEEIIPTLKKNTKLKLRGEDADKSMMIDDKPDGENDPHHYIIVIGVTDVSIIGYLSEIKVPVNAIINIKTEYNQKLCSFDSEISSEVVHIQINDMRAVDSPSDVDQNLNHLWKTIETLFKSADFNSILRNVAVLELFVPEECFPEKEMMLNMQLLNMLDQEKKNTFAAWLFDRLSELCYKCLELYEDYQLYLNFMNVKDVSINPKCLFPSLLAKTSPAKSSGVGNNQPFTDLRYYNKLMNHVPMQGETVNIILDCLLEQVVILVDGHQPLYKELSSSEEVDEIVKNYLENILGHIGSRNNSVCWNKKKDLPKKPQVVYHGDIAKTYLMNIFNEELYFKKCEEKMRNIHPYANFMNYFKFKEEKWIEILTSRKQLFKNCSSLDISEENFERALCQYIFESLPLQSLSDEGHVIECDNLKEQYEKISCSWDHPYYAASNKEIVQEANISLRNLDIYCWLERFEASVLYQILDKCSELRPYIRTYYCYGSNKLMLIMHNPCNRSMYNKISWSGWLHSDVGFRSYLQNIANDIKEWVIKKKKNLLEKEEENTDKLTVLLKESLSIKDKSRYGLKTRAEIKVDNEHLMSGVKDKELKVRTKSGKNNQRKSPDLKKPVLKSERQPSASSKKRSENLLSTDKSIKNVEEAIKGPDMLYDFYGYNLGDDLLHLNYECMYLFPQTNCCIKIEKNVFLNGNTYIGINVIKGCNFFYLEFVNPLTEVEVDALNKETRKEKLINLNDCDNFESKSFNLQEVPKLPALPKYRKNISSYSAFKASFSDGLILTISSSLSSELSSILSELEVDSIEKSVSVLNPKSSKTKQNKKEEELEQLRKEKENLLKLEERKSLIKQVIQEKLQLENLYLTVPNGLRITFVHNALINDYNNLDNILRYLIVRLSYSSPNTKTTNLDNLNEVFEVYRSVTDDGAVVKYLSNKMVEILYPNGKIIKSILSLSSDEILTSTGSQVDDHLIGWHFLSASGEQKFIKDHSIENLNPLSIFNAKCLETNQELKTREDGVVIVYKDGGSVTEFLDGTRISTYIEFIGEKYFDFVKVEHDKFPTVIVNKSTSDITVQFGNGREIHGLHSGGYIVSNKCLKEIEINNEGKVDIFLENSGSKENFDVVELNQCNSNQSLFLKDRQGNQFCVNSVGNISVEKSSEHEMNETISPRYFVINPDGSGEELLTFDNVKTFMTIIENDNTALVLKEDLESNPEATAFTVIRPFQGVSSEVWKTKKERSIFPVGLQERDFMSSEVRTNSGTLSVTLANDNIETKENNVFEIRHLIKYKPLDVNTRKLIIKGINNYNKFILTQQKSKKRFKSFDIRKNEEKEIAEKLLKSFFDQQKQLEYQKDINSEIDIICEYVNAFSPKYQKTFNRAQNVAHLQKVDKVQPMALNEAKSLIINHNFPMYFATDEGRSFLYTNSILSDQRKLKTPDNVMAIAEDFKNLIALSHSPKSNSSKEFCDATLCSTSIENPTFRKLTSCSSYDKTSCESIFIERSGKTLSEGVGSIGDEGFNTNKTLSHVNTTLMSPSTTYKLSAKLKGFLISPDFVDFGVLTEGKTYVFPISIKNVGLTSKRFIIKQPPLSTGLKVVYPHGLVAAGMSKEISLEIFAVAVGVEGNCGIGQIYHKLTIITDLGTLLLPIIATIITQNETPERERPSKGTITLENSPSVRETINRPPK